MTRRPVLAALPLLLALSGPAAAASGDRNVAVLQALDKITARITTLEAPVGVPVAFGTLEIVARRCVTRPPEEPPESTAFVEIAERRPGEPETALFAGWMFASSPAVSSIEHPVYDVWVISCKNASSSERDSSAGKDAVPSSAEDSSSR